MKISLKEVQLAQSAKQSDLLNDVLYDMVRKYPSHKFEDQVYAKVVIIGRAYSASLERGAGHDSDNEGKFYRDKIIPAFIKSNIDELLEKVKGIKKISTSNLATILQVHKGLIEIINDKTEIENRSFASKYLHFHCKNAFYIYDSIAKKRISELGYKNEYTIPDSDISVDGSYKNFCFKCLSLQDQVFEEHKILLTPRQIDNLLLQKK